MLSTRPFSSTCCRIGKIWQKGHTWDIHGYDTARMVNQMTVGSWITFNSMTSRYSDIHFFNQYLLYVVQVWSSSLYMFTIFFQDLHRKTWIILTCYEALVCPIFSKQIRWIGWKATAMELIWICWRHFGMNFSSCILPVLDTRWKMPKLQLSDVRCKVKGCWCVAVFHDVCGPIPSSNFRSLKDIFLVLSFLKSFRLEKQPLFCNHFCPERPSFNSALKWNCLWSHWLHHWSNATWLR